MFNWKGGTQSELMLKTNKVLDRTKYFNFESFEKWASKITPSNGLSERNRDSRLDSFPKLTGMVPFK